MTLTLRLRPPGPGPPAGVRSSLPPALKVSYLARCAVAPCSKEAQDATLCQKLWETTERQLAAALASEAAAEAAAAAAAPG